MERDGFGFEKECLGLVSWLFPCGFDTIGISVSLLDHAVVLVRILSYFGLIPFVCNCTFPRTRMATCGPMVTVVQETTAQVIPHVFYHYIMVTAEQVEVAPLHCASGCTWRTVS